MKVDYESFLATAEVIWRMNSAARKAHDNSLDLGKWMVEETERQPSDVQSWGTMGFTVTFLRGGAVHASVEGWFAQMMANTAAPKTTQPIIRRHGQT